MWLSLGDGVGGYLVCGRKVMELHNGMLRRYKAPDSATAAQTDDTAIARAQIVTLVVPIEFCDALVKRFESLLSRQCPMELVLYLGTVPPYFAKTSDRLNQSFGRREGWIAVRLGRGPRIGIDFPRVAVRIKDEDKGLAFIVFADQGSVL